MNHRIVHINVKKDPPMVVITQQTGQRIYHPGVKSHLRLIRICKGNPKIFKHKFLPLSRLTMWFDI